MSTKPNLNADKLAEIMKHLSQGLLIKDLVKKNKVRISDDAFHQWVWQGRVDLQSDDAEVRNSLFAQLAKAYASAKAMRVSKVEEQLYDKALNKGQSVEVHFEATEDGKEVKKKIIKKEIEKSESAQKFILQNTSPDEWKERKYLEIDDLSESFPDSEELDDDEWAAKYEKSKKSE